MIISDSKTLAQCCRFIETFKRWANVGPTATFRPRQYQPLDSVGPTATYSDRDRTNHYTTLGQRTIASWDVMRASSPFCFVGHLAP